MDGADFVKLPKTSLNVEADPLARLQRHDRRREPASRLPAQGDVRSIAKALRK
jgi:hypothetical protein